LLLSVAVTTVFVGFQHYLVMLGTSVLIATILVPLMGGGHVSLPPRSSVFSPFRLLGVGDRRALTSTVHERRRPRRRS